MNARKGCRDTLTEICVVCDSSFGAEGTKPKVEQIALIDTGIGYRSTPQVLGLPA